MSVCPVVGTSTTVLPPDHPALSSDPEARCPVTNAKVAHHESHIIHSHPSSPTIPDDPHKRMDASPVVGAVSAYLPPTHPKLTEQESGKVCPVTNATLAHHEGKLHLHPSVADDAPVSKCPVAGASMNQ
ncbi:hypothetical protein LTR02_015878 [Friedmanniomyces endolithicus]|nr:hypothetical protein LTR94_008688 [Friedmanniomyces endolithicus]KAK0776828.1 hypothetical protein LTR59_014058 [Friedmanniomyces endolithicus]KAK0795518.1 hypothetical protein LTR38_008847 [Friedmanniomyces endolithicus]KAK0817686.1 hypothetical protein LTR75_003021 [Friedmanniomyces endolithicus]KAK0838235.1 hypothetical protein LTR03_012194 [Friedmanniomyces endolithicus]